MVGRLLKKRRAALVVFGLIAFLSYEWSALVPKANAIPAFARKYNFACNVCHVPGFPKLNDFGNLFRDHGYQLGSDNDLPEFEGLAMGYWPVSLRSTVGYRTQTLGVNGSGGSGTNGPGDVTTGSFGFKTLNFLSYGILAKNVSYGIIYAPALGSGNFQTNPTGGDLPNAFVRLNNVQRFLGGSADNYLMNVKVGKYEPELPFSAFRNPTQNNTPIVIYNYQAGTVYTSANFPSNNRISSGYTNATLSSLQRGQPGIEVAGIKQTAATNGFFRYSLNAFSNSQATGATGASGGRGFYFYGHATQSFGGYGIVSGHRIGLSGWYGDAPTQANPLSTTTGTAGGGQKFYRVSVDGSTTFDGQWNLFGAFIHAQDDKNLMTATSVVNRQDARWNGGFVELDWYPNELPFFGTPGWLFLYRYDVVRNEQQGNRTFRGDFNNVDSHTWMSRYYLHFSSRTDIAWHTEYNWFRSRATGNNGQDTIGQMFFTGFDFAL
ncbi:MAG: hypothetical protein AB1411_11935 [Nitrospirota bacterium]